MIPSNENGIWLQGQLSSIDERESKAGNPYKVYKFYPGTADVTVLFRRSVDPLLVEGLRVGDRVLLLLEGEELKESNLFDRNFKYVKRLILLPVEARESRPVAAAGHSNGNQRPSEPIPAKAS